MTGDFLPERGMQNPCTPPLNINMASSSADSPRRGPTRKVDFRNMSNLFEVQEVQENQPK